MTQNWSRIYSSNLIVPTMPPNMDPAPAGKPLGQPPNLVLAARVAIRNAEITTGEVHTSADMSEEATGSEVGIQR